MNDEVLRRELRRIAIENQHRCFGCGFEHNCSIHGCAIIREALEWMELVKGIPTERLQELAQAEKDGRLVVFDKPREPLVWGDNEHNTALCPNCNHDLMGGFQEAESCEMPMYQCPYCGHPISDTKVLTREEAEAALKKREDQAHD